MLPIVTAPKFHFPSNGEDQDAFMENLWNQGTMFHLTLTRRMSLCGNPQTKGVFILDNDDTSVPSEFECTQLPKGCVPL